MMFRHLVVHDCIDKHRHAVLGKNLGKTKVTIWGGIIELLYNMQQKLYQDITYILLLKLKCLAETIVIIWGVGNYSCYIICCCKNFIRGAGHYCYHLGWQTLLLFSGVVDPIITIWAENTIIVIFIPQVFGVSTFPLADIIRLKLGI